MRQDCTARANGMDSSKFAGFTVLWPFRAIFDNVPMLSQNHIVDRAGIFPT